MTIKFIDNEKGNPVGKLADAELIFSEGPLAGLKLIGFAVWERRAGGAASRNVTVPARQYVVNGERRSFALLRPADGDPTASIVALRELILAAYAKHEDGAVAERCAEISATIAAGGPFEQVEQAEAQRRAHALAGTYDRTKERKTRRR